MVYFCYVLSFDNLIYLVYKFRKKFFEKSVRLWFRSCLYRCKGKNQKGASEEEIRAGWQNELEAYKKMREKYLLYE